ncbi:DUF6415 family natural product biosynthesis protein [Streptomyces tremellae]|uniref:Uncharacterized protein n=1 Tax=Streptomyces tremellae TaxID=1124239 RepID=A0ABP7EH31_9ACTN
MTTTAASTAAIQATIDRAGEVRRGQGRHIEMAHLADQLALHIGQMMPAARRAVEELWHGDPRWYSLRSRLDGIEYQAARGLGDGVLAAHVELGLLAADAAWLLARYGPTE